MNPSFEFISPPNDESCHHKNYETVEKLIPKFNRLNITVSKLLKIRHLSTSTLKQKAIQKNILSKIDRFYEIPNIIFLTVLK